MSAVAGSWCRARRRDRRDLFSRPSLPARVSRRQAQPSRPVIGEVERPGIGGDPAALTANEEEITMSPSLALANALLYGFIAYMLYRLVEARRRYHSQPPLRLAGRLADLVARGGASTGHDDRGALRAMAGETTPPLRAREAGGAGRGRTRTRPLPGPRLLPARRPGTVGLVCALPRSALRARAHRLRDGLPRRERRETSLRRGRGSLRGPRTMPRSSALGAFGAPRARSPPTPRQDSAAVVR